MEELISIGLSFYNDKSTLKLAIKSVFAQTYTNWELILIDDGSTDGSLEIARKIADPRVRLISDGTNKGLINRLNQIATLANGIFLARMDADDMMQPTRIEKQVAYLKNNPDIDLVDTGAYSIYRDNEPIGKRGLQNINTNPKYILTHAMLLHASVVGKTSWFIQNPYNNNYTRAEDYELWCRTFSYSRFGRIKEPLYIVREGKINVKNYLKSSQTIRKIINHYWRGILSLYEFEKAIFILHAKETAYKFFSVLNIHHLLVNTRNTHLSKIEKQKVSEIIAEIESINIYSVHAKDNLSI